MKRTYRKTILKELIKERQIIIFQLKELLREYTHPPDYEKALKDQIEEHEGTIESYETDLYLM